VSLFTEQDWIGLLHTDNKSHQSCSWLSPPPSQAVSWLVDALFPQFLRDQRFIFNKPQERWLWLILGGAKPDIACIYLFLFVGKTL